MIEFRWKNSSTQKTDQWMHLWILKFQISIPKDWVVVLCWHQTNWNLHRIWEELLIRKQDLLLASGKLVECWKEHRFLTKLDWILISSRSKWTREESSHKHARQYLSSMTNPLCSLRTLGNLSLVIMIGKHHPKNK